ncbi:MAG: F0F1 ATP synthase subunit A [Deltaproteobacteria bacterium]|nr:F0F1 ATP synthase subunit A [Deltaproteobacteria bacterium]
MEDMTYIPTYSFDLFGLHLTVNTATLFNTWVVMAFLIIVAFLATRRLKQIPGPLQRMMEVYVSSMDKLVRDTLETTSRGYLPLIATMFLFLVLCNWLGIIPGLEEPTRDLNTPLSLGIMGFVLTHFAAVREKGIGTYLKEYAEPFFVMAPLNIIGELAKVISISFRLFGNIMGGAIIIIVVSHMVYNLVLPPFLNAFFGLFVGTIQAFVFTMLTITYIAVATK